MDLDLSKLFQRLFYWLKNHSKTIKIISLIFLVIAACFLFQLTYKNIYQAAKPNPSRVIKLILLDLLLVFSIISITLTSYFKHSSFKDDSFANNKIQRRTVMYFSFIAAIPAIAVSIYSFYFFHHGIENWFNSMIRSSFEESVRIAKSYLDDHERQINSEARSISFFIDHLKTNPYFDVEILNNYLTKTAEEKSLVDVIVFQSKPFLTIGKSRFSFSLAKIPDSHFLKLIDAAEHNVLVTSNHTNKITTIIRLDNFESNTYLLISKQVDHGILDYLQKTKDSYNEFINLNANTNTLKLEFYATFVVILAILVFCAYFIGHYLARSILKPLLELIHATKEIQKGNYAISLIPKEENEISTLINAFNIMAHQISEQRNDLIQANYKVAFRSHFNETVISNISSGIIVVNYDYDIKVINPPAKSALYIHDAEVTGKKINSYFPEVIDLLERKVNSPSNTILQEQLTISRNKHSFILLIRISSESFEGFSDNFFITFDDITTLVRAQEHAAWSDLARRIAHEIKNPLTPIHLAAQRIEKKYSKEVSDPNMLIKYTQTITRHVIQIGHIIEDFVSFARNKTPNIQTININKLIDEAVFSRKCLDKDIEYNINLNDKVFLLECDPNQINQVLINIIKNSEESFKKDNINSLIKQIDISSYISDDSFTIIIEDNGTGFHIDMYNKLTEPYITNKTHGSGLGLAIVKKIIDDHKATINFENRTSGGARVIIKFRRKNKS